MIRWTVSLLAATTLLAGCSMPRLFAPQAVENGHFSKVTPTQPRLNQPVWLSLEDLTPGRSYELRISRESDGPVGPSLGHTVNVLTFTPQSDTMALSVPLNEFLGMDGKGHPVFLASGDTVAVWLTRPGASGAMGQDLTIAE